MYVAYISGAPATQASARKNISLSLDNIYSNDVDLAKTVVFWCFYKEPDVGASVGVNPPTTPPRLDICNININIRNQATACLIYDSKKNQYFSWDETLKLWRLCNGDDYKRGAFNDMIRAFKMHNDDARISKYISKFNKKNPAVWREIKELISLDCDKTTREVIMSMV